MKKILLVSACFFCAIFANAQWSPTYAPLFTNSKVLINYIQTGTLPVGSPPPPPVFHVKTTDNSVVGMPVTRDHLFVTQDGWVGIGTGTPVTTFHVASLVSYFPNRVGIGVVPNTSAGLQLEGDFFVTNGATKAWKMTKLGELALNSGTQDLFKINPTGIVNIYNDVIVSQGSTIQCRIYANGLIRAREVKIDLATIPPDYVFDKNYSLMPLNELEMFLAQHKHLPGIPSANEMQEEGSVSVGEMQLKLLEKVEELTLYIMQLKKENEMLNQRLCNLEGK
jgi:hypothetical protein